MASEAERVRARLDPPPAPFLLLARFALGAAEAQAAVCSGACLSRLLAPSRLARSASDSHAGPEPPVSP